MIATTRGALFRGTTQDEFGDAVDDNSPEAIPYVEVEGDDGLPVRRPFDDFPVSIIERSRQEFDEASNAWRSVRFFVGRIPPHVPAKAGDRIRDNRSGAFFIVDEVESMARGLSGRASVTLKMKRTAP
jgi:hypothetical protein